ncbi:uncharacterized protein LOC135830632 [Sycon ciliatum]|uniref:uncharacterized protein LOC135830630 n=1 Tax=Sycon ciliatum TaxID=27933 RepID=UPI0031F6D5FB
MPARNSVSGGKNTTQEREECLELHPTPSDEMAVEGVPTPPSSPPASHHRKSNRQRTSTTKFDPSHERKPRQQKWRPALLRTPVQKLRRAKERSQLPAMRLDPNARNFTGYNEQMKHRTRYNQVRRPEPNEEGMLLPNVVTATGFHGQQYIDVYDAARSFAHTPSDQIQTCIAINSNTEITTLHDLYTATSWKERALRINNHREVMSSHKALSEELTELRRLHTSVSSDLHRMHRDITALSQLEAFRAR